MHCTLKLFGIVSGTSVKWMALKGNFKKKQHINSNLINQLQIKVKMYLIPNALISC